MHIFTAKIIQDFAVLHISLLIHKNQCINLQRAWIFLESFEPAEYKNKIYNF